MGLIDEAALCMLALSKMPACIEDDIEEELCRVFCCCKKYPVIRKKKLMQKCADMMLKALRTPGRPYENSVPYRMDTKEVLKINPKTGRWIYRDDSTGARHNICIPDISVYDSSGNLDKVCDFKFPGDDWQTGQREAYAELVGRNEKKVIKLDNDYCKCDDRVEYRSNLTEEEKQGMLDRVNLYFITEWDKYGLHILDDVQELSEEERKQMLPELESAVENARKLAEQVPSLSDILLNMLPFGRMGKAARGLGRMLPRPGFVPLR